MSGGIDHLRKSQDSDPVGTAGLGKAVYHGVGTKARLGSTCMEI